MSGVLRVVSGQRAGDRVTVQPGEALSIGRSGESDLQLLGSGVSRFHCVIEEQASGLVITDLNSSNGTFVNGQRVKRQPLESGAEVEIGTVKVVVESVPGRKASPLMCLLSDSVGSETRVIHRAALADMANQGATRPDTAVPPGDPLQRYLAALEKVNKAIATEEKPGRLMSVVLDIVLDVIPAERGVVLLLEKGAGMRPAFMRVAQGCAADPHLPLSRAVVNECLERRASVLCHDLRADPRYQSAAGGATDHIRSALCAPLACGDRVLGAIYLDTGSQTAAFGERDVEFLGGIAHHAGLALHRVELVDSLERLFVGAVETLVAAVEAKDIYTYGHSARVSKLARRVAEGMGLPEDDQERVKLAGLLHDIGKIGIPEAVLSRRGRLTEDEWAYVRSHPQIGESIIRQMGSDRVEELCPLVRHHHERLDGSGYPDRLTGEDIPLGARVLSVADAYDAMRSNRPYRAPFSSKEAIAELRGNAGKQFDPRAIAALAEIRPEHARA